MNLFKELFFKFHNYRFRKTKKKNIYFKFSEKKIKNLYDSKILQKQKQIILATQVGRGGGKWLVGIINHCKNATAFGERNRTAEAIFRYNCSYDKNFNLRKILHLIKTEALSDWKNSKTSYISSPYFSHGIKILEKNLKPYKFVIILRDFDGLFYSLVNKSWYKNKFSLNVNKYSKKLPDLFLDQPNHFYGRYINFDKDNKKFLTASSSVKVAIFMHQTIKKIYEGILKVKKENLSIFNLNEADQNFDYCKNFLKKLDLDLNIQKKSFLKLKKRTANSIENEKTILNKNDLFEIKKIKKKYQNYLDKIKSFS